MFSFQAPRRVSAWSGEKPSWRTTYWRDTHEQDSIRIWDRRQPDIGGRYGQRRWELWRGSRNATAAAWPSGHRQCDHRCDRSGVQQPSPTASADTSTTTSPTSDQVAESNSGANATIGATDPGVQQPAPEANATTGTSTTTTTDGSSTTTADNTGANATIGATDPGVQQPQNTDATADSSGSSTTTTESDTTTGDSSAAMPSGDVTETSRVGDLNTAAGGHAEAITALKKAQLAADAGDEATCMTELGTAKAAMGVQ
jgi:hypothetical protein